MVRDVTSIEGVPRFQWQDYVVVCALLVLNAFIGFYHAYTNKKKTSESYLLGNRSMSVFPIAMSLLASFFSAVTMLGTPADVYIHGVGYLTMAISGGIALPLVAAIYIPLFYRLRITSVFEYLEMRFNKSVRVYTAIVYIINMEVYMGIVLYGPSTALEAVTGMPFWLSMLVVGGICIIYTSVGGLKAVVYTDTFQIFTMYITTIVTLCVGMSVSGGWSEVFRLAKESGRLHDITDFHPSLFSRHSVWSVIIGGVFFWTQIYGVNQAQVQRYLALPSARHGAWAIFISTPCFIIMIILTCFQGLVLYGFYRNCDPIALGVVTATDQTLAVFALQIFNDYPGLAGFFVVGIFSGSLSSISSGMNSLAAVVLHDCILPIKDLSHTTQFHLSKALSFSFGIMALVFAFIASQIGGILQLALSLFGIIGGPIMGVFVLGYLSPWPNARGANIGMTVSLVLLVWIGFGAKIAGIQNPQPIRGIEDCLAPNKTVADFDGKLGRTYEQALEHNSNYLGIYQLSYLHYGVVGTMCTLIVGILASLPSFNKNSDVDRRLLVPVFYYIFFFLPNEWRQKLIFGVDKVKYPETETTMELIKNGGKN